MLSLVPWKVGRKEILCTVVVAPDQSFRRLYAPKQMLQNGDISFSGPLFNGQLAQNETPPAVDFCMYCSIPSGNEDYRTIRGDIRKPDTPAGEPLAFGVTAGYTINKYTFFLHWERGHED